MRLLVATTVHPPDDPRIRHKLIESLLPQSEVTYAVRAPGPAASEGFEVRELRGGRLRRGLAAAGLLVRGGYDAAVIHDPELLPAALAARLLRRRVVFDLHEDLPARLQDRGPLPGWLRPAGARLAAGLLRMVERVMPVTLAETGYARLFSRPHPVFPNGLHGEMPEPREPDGEVGCLYLGDITVERGARLLVEAVPPEMRLTLAGRCGSDVRGELERRAAARGVEIDLLGFVPHPDVLGLAARAEVAVSPLADKANYRHSMPTKVLEYLAVGVPVVASDLPGTRAVIGDLPGVRLVPPGDADAWRGALEEVSGSPSWREAARRAAEVVPALHRWPAEEVREFYRGLVR